MSKAMKILIISDAWHPQINGVVRTYEYLCKELDKMGHQTHVIGPSDFKHHFGMPGYPEIRMALLPSRALRRMIEAFSPDHIHIATEGALGWAARKYCVQHNKLFSTSYHTHFPDYTAKRVAKFLPFLYKPVRNLCISLELKFHAPSSVVLTATDSLDEELRSWGFKNKFARLSRGVYLDRFYPASTDENLDTLPDMPKDIKRPIALYVGRVAIEKNLEAFLSMEWSGSKVIVGDGPSMDDLSRTYKDALFLGKQEGNALASIYRASDIFAFPSKTDTFGIVIIEALASGLPVAAYNVTGPKDILTQPILGAMEEDNFAKSAMRALATNQEPNARQKRADFVKAYYTWENAAQQFANTVANFQNAQPTP